MNRRRVLVVDDDKSILAYLSDLLADRYDVDCLDSGEGVVPYLAPAPARL